MKSIPLILAFAFAAGCGKKDSATEPTEAEVQKIEADANEAATKERTKVNKQHQLED